MKSYSFNFHYESWSIFSTKHSPHDFLLRALRPPGHPFRRRQGNIISTLLSVRGKWRLPLIGAIYYWLMFHDKKIMRLYGIFLLVFLCRTAKVNALSMMRGSRWGNLNRPLTGMIMEIYNEASCPMQWLVVPLDWCMICGAVVAMPHAIPILERYIRHYLHYPNIKTMSRICYPHTVLICGRCTCIYSTASVTNCRRDPRGVENQYHIRADRIYGASGSGWLFVFIPRASILIPRQDQPQDVHWPTTALISK